MINSLRKAGKLEQLSEDELLFACVERGIDVDVTADLAAGLNFHEERRQLLGQWLQLTDGKDGSGSGGSGWRLSWL